MTDAELLAEIKEGQNISGANFDAVLTQKMLAAKSYLKRSGVSDDTMNDFLAVSVIVMMVNDMWNLDSGEVKFSVVLNSLITQLAAESKAMKLLSSMPSDGATDIAIDCDITLTFNKRIEAYDIKLIKTHDRSEINITDVLDLSENVVTLTISDDLDPDAEYAIVINNIISVDGPELGYTVLKFTTAVV